MAKAQTTVTMKQLAAEIAQKNDMTKKQAEAVLEGFVGLVAKTIKKGSKVRITGLGIIQVRQTKARMGRNPATGETIKIPAKKKVAFRASKDLKESVL